MPFWVSPRRDCSTLASIFGTPPLCRETTILPPTLVPINSYITQFQFHVPVLFLLILHSGHSTPNWGYLISDISFNRIPRPPLRTSPVASQDLRSVQEMTAVRKIATLPPNFVILLAILSCDEHVKFEKSSRKVTRFL